MAEKKKPIRAKVINGNLNIRKEPSMTSEIVGFLDHGTIISGIDKGEEWSKTPMGYVKNEFLRFM